MAEGKSDRPGYVRDESDAHRLDRNYAELLQELRVAQTGVQILFAFLLTISFQQRFPTLNATQRGLYVATLVCAAVAAALFIAPVAMHRVMFRRHLKDELVSYTGRLAAVGLVFLALAMLGSVLLIVDFVSGAVAGAIITALLACLFAWLWYLLPSRWNSDAPVHHTPSDESGPDPLIGPD
jgi:O-antigen/teichoic acid export membrane protein